MSIGENNQWFKSSRSGGNGGSCVEVRRHDGLVQARDSKDSSGPLLSFSPAAWRAFLDDVRSGELELPD